MPAWEISVSLDLYGYFFESANQSSSFPEIRTPGVGDSGRRQRGIRAFDRATASTAWNKKNAFLVAGRHSQQNIGEEDCCS
jgi:hypothetical protein